MSELIAIGVTDWKENIVWVVQTKEGRLIAELADVNDEGQRWAEMFTFAPALHAENERLRAERNSLRDALQAAYDDDREWLRKGEGSSITVGTQQEMRAALALGGSNG